MAHRKPLPPSRLMGKPVLLAIMLYMVSLPLFLEGALSVYTATQRVLAWAIFAAASIPFVKLWLTRGRGVPLMPLLGAQYVVFYALAVFFEDSTRTLDGWIIPTSSAIDMTLLCVLLSIISIGIGYVVAGRTLRLRFRMFRFEPDPQRLFWYAIVTLLGAAALQLGQGTILGWSPGGLVRPVSVALSVDLGTAILACLFYQGRLAGWQKPVAFALLAGSVAVGFAGGMFQSAAQPLLIWAVCRWIIKGKVPMLALAFLSAAFFVLQPVKGSYRHLALLSGRSFTTTEKIGLYAELIRKQWLETAPEASNVMQENKLSAKKRLSMLLATAHYVEWTPYPLDYRNGSTLGFLAYGWIPRAIWPDKPIAQQANKILPVDYNVQYASSLNVTMFGVGHVAETYVNFGLLGIVPIFLLLGALYRIPQLLLERQRTVATTAIFVAVSVAMVPIGSSISDAFGGFLQQIVLQGILLRFFTAKSIRNLGSSGPRPPLPRAGMPPDVVTRPYRLANGQRP